MVLTLLLLLGLYALFIYLAGYIAVFITNKKSKNKKPIDTERSSTMKMKDCINRIDVIEAVADLYPFDNEKVIPVSEIDKLFDKIKSMPNVQAKDIEDLDLDDLER